MNGHSLPRGQRIAAGGFGPILLTEIHHLIRGIIHRGYYPGSATGTLMFFAGLMLLKSAWGKRG